MSKSKKVALERQAAAAEVEADRAVERALRAVVMRREGMSFGDIAERLGISQLEAEELAKVAYARLGEQEADFLRTEVEDRLGALVRKAQLDLALADSQSDRTALYRFLAGVEAQRSRLLGLNLRAAADDE